MTGADYINENKNNPARVGRIKKIQNLAKSASVSPDSVKIHIGRDWQWSRRRNRTPAQRAAQIVGQTNSRFHGYPTEIVFAWVE